MALDFSRNLTYNLGVKSLESAIKIEFISLSAEELCIKPVGSIDTITAVDCGTSINDRIDDIKKLLIDFAHALQIL